MFLRNFEKTEILANYRLYITVSNKLYRIGMRLGIGKGTSRCRHRLWDMIQSRGIYLKAKVLKYTTYCTCKNSRYPLENKILKVCCAAAYRKARTCDSDHDRRSIYHLIAQRAATAGQQC